MDISVPDSPIPKDFFLLDPNTVFLNHGSRTRNAARGV